MEKVLEKDESDRGYASCKYEQKNRQVNLLYGRVGYPLRFVRSYMEENVEKQRSVLKGTD